MSFGVQVAEDEVNELASYFVETNQWGRIAKGEIDIVRGEKGSGKSAIYSLLMTRQGDFFDQRILLVAAENPRGQQYLGIWWPIRLLRKMNLSPCGKYMP